MSKLGKLWTGAVAYVSLLVGAGLSVAGNLADTYRIRGAQVDAVDIVLAVGPPLATLLVAELFVSDWPRRWSLQTLRWTGVLIVGSLAMIVSWSHINELLAARGQNALVSILWPLAIDGLAIMAMAKILAMRVANLSTGNVATELASGMAMATGHAGPALDTLAKEVATLGHDVTDFLAKADRDVATGQMATDALPEWAAQLSSFDEDMDMAIRRSGQDLASEAEQYVAMTTGNALPKRVPVSQGVPAEAVELLRAWDGRTHEGREVDELLAAHFGKSARTARRWRSMVLGPVSSPPAGEG